MTCFEPFRALRPRAELAQAALCPPYDVVTRQEAEKIAGESPYSFMHVIRAEADLPEEEPYSEAVYRKGAENLDRLEKDGAYFTDEKPCYYIYSETMDGRSQTGIVGCSSIDDYENGVIKRHEVTRTEKELDRIRHFETCSADTEPVFFFFRSNPDISAVINRITESEAPEYDVNDCSGVRHRLWPVRNDADIVRLKELFSGLSELYIADGHHRTASAAKVGRKRREAAAHYDGTEEFNRFMAVSFPADQLKVYSYNRLIRDLNGLSTEEFLSRIAGVCTIADCGTRETLPEKKHTCTLYLDGKWYLLTFREDGGEKTADSPEKGGSTDPVKDLDVSYLQDRILAPVLGITDPKTDSRISFEGGVKGGEELKRRVDSGEMKAAFAMYPVSVEEIMKIADAGLVMPPKSTWFEPKLGSGLFVHRF